MTNQSNMQPDMLSRISLKREAACFASLSPDSIDAPRAIEDVELYIASSYCFDRPMIWVTLDIVCSYGRVGEKRSDMLGFESYFLSPFMRALIETASTKAAHRLNFKSEKARLTLVENVTKRDGYVFIPIEIIIEHCEKVLQISFTRIGYEESAQRLFQLPNSDSFLKNFCKDVWASEILFEDLRRNMIQKKRAEMISQDSQ